MIRKLKYGCLIALCLLLNACQTHIAKKDGPPCFYVDETKIPNAVPKREPLAKYGNMKFYNVFGKRYYVMRSNTHYDEVGIASWYGTKFHDRRTSSGEKYDMLAMTAAHKTLPLPTYVEVTNLKNHRKIIVKVNDRGPFAPNRIIDLSYVAAKKIGMIGHGTTMVRVRAINPYDFGRPKYFAHTKRPKPLFAQKKSFVKTSQYIYLQAGAFRNRENAQRMRQRLVALMLSTPVKVFNPATSRQLYRVQIGPIKDIVTANKITHKLKDLGINTNRMGDG